MINKLIALVGPTAVGKTTMAIWLGQRLEIEVVSADSRQIYRGLDIGTAKPTAQERQQVPHHLIDVVEPDETLTLAQYQALAGNAINDIQRRGCLPLLVGGSGQYIRAVLEGWQVPQVPPDPHLRQRLEQEAKALGSQAFHERLRAVDPVAADAIDPRNVRRVIRALEVYQKTGRPISELQHKESPPYRVLQIGLTMPRAELYRRIDSRIDHMLEKGLVEEVRSLLAQGYSADLPAMSSLGYRQITSYLKGEITLDEAARQIKRETRRFVRQQYVWFRLDDPAIRWFDACGEVEANVLKTVTGFLERTNTPLPQV